MQKTIRNTLAEHGFELTKPRAVLFDMDGVLYDSMPNHAVAWQQSMSAFGICMTAADAYATEGARGIDTIRQMVFEQQGRDISLDEAQHMYDLKTRLFHEMPHARIFYGARSFMRKLHDTGVTIGVVTGSGQRPLIERLLHDFAPYLTPSHIVTAYDVTRGKPAPDPYLMGLQKCGQVSPDRAIVIENAPLGIRAGVAAGCLTIAVNSGPLPDKTLLDEGAAFVVPTINTLNRLWLQLFNSDPASGHKQDYGWEEHYRDIMAYMGTHQRRPSKHRPEDHAMLNWIKYNKKQYARGSMPAERVHKFEKLLAMADRVRRLNQYE